MASINQTPHRPEYATAQKKAWGRAIELVVYDPSTVGTSGVSIGDAALQKGVVVSGLHTDFKVSRSRTYSENKAEFKIYNASAETRARMLQPGMRVRFSAGYTDQGGAVSIFWGAIGEGSSTAKVGTDWVTTLQCISALSEATGSGDIAMWAANHKDATDDQKRDMISQAINRIPVSFGFAPGTNLRRILLELQAVTGLSLYGADNPLFDSVTLKNGFGYAGGIRGCMAQFIAQCLRPIGWSMYIDNSTLVLFPQDDKVPYVVTAVNLTMDTGYLSSTDKTKNNVPPKVIKSGTKKTGISAPLKAIPRTYEVRCLLNPKIAPNTLAYITTPPLTTVLLIDEVTFEGSNYAGKGFDCTFEGHVWQGAK